MKCGDLELFGLLKGELSAEAQAEARAHLSTCESCGGESERMRIILRSLHTEEWIEPGPAFTERILAACDGQQETKEERRETEEEPAITSIGQFFRVLFGRARGTVPAWAVSVAVHMVIFGVLALVVITRVREDESELVMLFERTREPAGISAPLPKDIRYEPGSGPGLPERRDPEDPEFEKEPRGVERDVPIPIPVPGRPREEDDRRQKQYEYQRTWDTAGW
ncbi:MAG TPA: zf-HC2 domain-containing protein, partial [Planctomycetota bacterium]|nr:zf-HC2 domain-containing protein [Planctomycetota bacterium]